MSEEAPNDPNVPEVRIAPAGPLREVHTIPAILALRTHGGFDLRAAKRAVEDMVSNGSAHVDLGGYVGFLGDPAAQAMASVLVRDLRAAGVALHVGGAPFGPEAAVPG